MHRAARLADVVTKSKRIPNLTREVVSNGAPGKRILASIWGVFTFRGLSAALLAEQDGKSSPSAMFSGQIPIGDREYTFSGTLSNDHVYSSTSVTLLKGKRRAFVLGQFEFRGSKVEAFPYIIGDFNADFSDLGSRFFHWPRHSRIYPQAIDAFEKIRSVRSPTTTQLKALRKMNERAIKTAFAEIIGEPFVPKDWGGEKSDLYTSRVTISGEPHSAAFVFKGPGTRGPMYPSTLGKRGDQLVRAFDEPADLIVVQHHDQIMNAVIRQAEALAAEPARPRFYCIIDGADTWRILKAHSKLGH